MDKSKHVVGLSPSPEFKKWQDIVPEEMRALSVLSVKRFRTYTGMKNNPLVEIPEV